MAAISDGLTNGGRTDHFLITYDSSLSPADGLGSAAVLYQRCEEISVLVRQGRFPILPGALLDIPR